MNKALPAIGALLVVAVAGCGAPQQEADVASEVSVATSSPVESPDSEVGPASPIFGGLHPCTLLTPAEVEQITGVANLQPVIEPLSDGNVMCRWGEFDRGIDMDFMVVQHPEKFLGPQNDRSRQLSEQLGHSIDMTAWDGESCFLMTVFSEGRGFSITVNPDEAAIAARPPVPGDDTCDRAMPVMTSILTERIPWD